MLSLEVCGIDAFYGDVQALAGVSLYVREGEVVALVGANGAGKTTTLRCISGILRPRRGSIKFDGNRLEVMPAHLIVASGIVHVPEGRQIFPGMTVLENLLMGAYNPRAWSDRGKTLEEVFSLFPVLRERRDQVAGTLSGGEQQMLAIGRGLMARPRILLMDEPSLGLAPLVVARIFTTIQEIRRQRGIGILLVEQNARLALEVADRAYVLEAGRIVMEGSGTSLLADTRVRQAYLGI
jgi:branched-chain amino acid transport system ATP-binding protein